MHPETSTIIGLDLSGARNQKTTLAVIKYFAREKKAFFTDLIEGIGGDEDLFKTLKRFLGARMLLATGVPTTLPPCLSCTRSTCKFGACMSPDAKWMKRLSAENSREITPYTQRPVEIWIRHRVFPLIPTRFRFDLDETLGGSKAPRTARMVVLARSLGSTKIIETLPKLSVALWATQYRTEPRWIENYRKLETGAQAREKILDQITEAEGVFLYERDRRKLIAHLGAFDAFISAVTGVAEITGRVEAAPKGFPKNSGWITHPKRPSAASRRGPSGP